MLCDEKRRNETNENATDTVGSVNIYVGYGGREKRKEIEIIYKAEYIKGAIRRNEFSVYSLLQFATHSIRSTQATSNPWKCSKARKCQMAHDGSKARVGM